MFRTHALVYSPKLLCSSHLIVDHWFLMCNDPFQPDVGLGLQDANIVSGIHTVTGAGDFTIYFPKPFKQVPVITLTAHGKLGKAEACLTDVTVDYGNILKPDGKLGNAMTFPWSSAVKGNGPAPGPQSAAQATTGRKYYQQKGSNLWIQVQLPKPVSCYQTVLVGYPSSHEPKTDGGAYIDASNDGKSWTRILAWSKHKGAGTAYVHKNYAESSSSSGLNKYGMALDAKKGSFRFWKTGGTSFTK